MTDTINIRKEYFPAFRYALIEMAKEGKIIQFEKKDLGDVIQIDFGNSHAQYIFQLGFAYCKILSEKFLSEATLKK